MQKVEELVLDGAMSFGPIAVEADGVIFKGGLLWGDQRQPWENIERYEVQNGHLVFFLRNYWFFSTISLRLADIPDYFALLAMLQSSGRKAVNDLVGFLPPKTKATAAS